MTTPDVERKVRQLDNDVQDIYTMLTGISETQQQHGGTLGALRHSLAELRGTQMRHGNRLDELDAAVADVAATQARHGNRLDDLDAKLDAILDRLGPGPGPAATG